MPNPHRLLGGRGGVQRPSERPSISPNPAQRRRSTVRGLIKAAWTISYFQDRLGEITPDNRKATIMFWRERGLISDVQTELLIAHNGLAAA